MNSDSGFGANGAPFEYAVAEAKNAKLRLKKLLFLLAYVLYGATVLIVGVAVKLILPILCFIPLSIWIIVFFTWKYTQVEYEYSFFSGTLTVSKILGGRKRKNLTKVHIRDLATVFPYSEKALQRAEGYGAKETVFAASSAEAPDLYVALWEDKETGVRHMLCLELNEKAIKIIKYYNMAAFAK
ncbi:MAG: hypothetical protein E7643_02820 [Ruminococcaceae bacterium]|nr:hypothetical protein [Oscillospiraceae bacterium]